jgi:Flp pilus assembly protein TadG
MMIVTRRINHTARGFLRDQRGSPAVEFALIAPVLMLLVFGIVQFGFAFYTYNEMLNGAREGARRLAVGATMEVARERALDVMVLDRNYLFPTPTPAADEVTMTITLKLSEAMIVSVLLLPDFDLTASVTMHKE